MSRRLLIAVLAAVGCLATAAPVAAAPTPTPAPPRDTAAVCATTATTVKTGLEDFVTRMQQAGTQAQQGDEQGAQATVQQGGQRLVAIGTQLRVDSTNADNAQLKSTVEQLADQFTTLGRSVTSISALRSFDTTRIDDLGRTMTSICGTSFNPAPSAS